MPVNIVPLTGTWVRLLMCERNDGNNPSLAIAINMRGWNQEEIEEHKLIFFSPLCIFL